MEQEMQNLFKKADFCIVTSDYLKAKQIFGEILEQDSKNARAWYGKSKLPIVQEDIVIIQGCSISVLKYQSLDITQKTGYLQQCGLPYSQALDGDSLLRVNLLIEKEHIKYLNAVCYAKDEKAKYEKELAELKTKNGKRGESEKKIAVRISLVSLPLVVLILGNLIYSFIQTGLPYLIFSMTLCIIPYVLSVIGMTFYSKAKHEGNNIVTGLVLTLLSLLFSNVALIIGVIFLIIK